MINNFLIGTCFFFLFVKRSDLEVTNSIVETKPQWLIHLCMRKRVECPGKIIPTSHSPHTSYGQIGPKWCKQSSPLIGLQPRIDLSSRLAVVLGHSYLTPLEGFKILKKLRRSSPSVLSGSTGMGLRLPGGLGRARAVLLLWRPVELFLPQALWWH